MYVKKILDSDWLRALQFQGNRVQQQGNTVTCCELPFWHYITLFVYINNG